MYDVIVVGGGVVGWSAAYHCGRAGLRTTLIDRADAGKATAAGAGILAPPSSGLTSDDWFTFAIEAVAYYSELMDMLAADDAGDTGYALAGLMVVAVGEDEDTAYAESRRVSFERQRQRKSPAAEDLHDITMEDAQRRFPALAAVRRAYFYRHAARVDGRLLAGALQRAALRQGVEHRQAGVDGLVYKDSTVVGVRSTGETVGGGVVVIAGGAWSGALADDLGIVVPIQPQRGQIIHLLLPGTTTADWPIITAFHGHYMVPWPDSRVVVGATRETGSGFQPQTTAVGVREVLDEAIRVAPGLANASIGDIRVGLRPATPDGLPLLGPVPKAPNVYLTAGHGATGLQLGPYSGKLVADMIAGHPIATNLTAMDPTRFRDAH